MRSFLAATAALIGLVAAPSAVATASTGVGPARTVHTVVAHTGVVHAYTYSGHEKLYAHYDPRRTHAPWAIEVHGGYWERGNGDGSQIGAWAEHSRARGFQVFVIDYRLSSEAPWPAPLYDTEAAVRWVRAHAKQFGLDRNRGVLVGGSAGGLLSAIAAMHGGVVGSVDKAGVVDVRAAMSAPNAHLGRAVKELLGCTYAACPALWRSAQVQSYIGPHTPPFLIIHSVHDHTVPASISEAFYRKLRHAGRAVSLHVIPGSRHSMGLKPNVLALTDAFLDKVVAKPASWPTVGTVTAGRVVRVRVGRVVEGDTVHYAWRLNGRYIRHATHPTYRVPRTTVHDRLQVTVRVFHGRTQEWSGTSTARTVRPASKK